MATPTEARDQAATGHKLAEAELRDARDNRKLAQLEYKRQMEIIRLKTIRSPVDGVVVECILNVGELAEAGVGRKPILKLAEVDVLCMEVLPPAGIRCKATIPGISAGVTQAGRGSLNPPVLQLQTASGSGVPVGRAALPRGKKRR